MTVGERGRQHGPRPRARLVVALLAGGLLAGCALDTVRESSPSRRVRETPGKTAFPQRVPEGHDGPFQSWWADGVLREEGSYRDGRRHGVVRGYNPDGSLRFEGRFEDGVPVGEMVLRHRDGTLAATETIEGGSRQGVRTEYYPGGALRSESTWVDGRRHGPAATYHENGIRATEGRYEQGLPAGEWTHRNPDGRVTSVVHTWVQGGERVGSLEMVYGPDGVITAQTLRVRRDGRWHGRTTLWHPNGRQAALTETVDDRRHGRDVGWDENGRKRVEGSYADDVRSGTWRHYDEAGRLVRTVEYRDGREVGTG